MRNITMRDKSQEAFTSYIPEKEIEIDQNKERMVSELTE